jgi:hypothetical protein
VFAGVLSFVPDGREYFWPPKESDNRNIAFVLASTGNYCRKVVPGLLRRVITY